MPPSAPAANADRSRAAWPGSGRARRSMAAAATSAGMALAVGACGSSGSASGFPSWLPAATLHPHDDAVLTGTAARPALTSEGDTVEVVTAHWRVKAEVAGPVVPGEGLDYQQNVTTCTWTVTMWAATGPVPVSTADFDSLDSLGDVYRVSLVGAPPPAVLHPGQRTTFRIRADEAVGEGLMRWAPDGRHIVAKWDYEVEND